MTGARRRTTTSARCAIRLIITLPLIVPGFRLCGKHKAAWAIFHSKPSSAKGTKTSLDAGTWIFGCNECGTQVGTVSFNLTFRIEQWLKYHCRMVIVYNRDVTTTGYTTIMPDDLGASQREYYIISNSSSSSSANNCVPSFSRNARIQRLL